MKKILLATRPLVPPWDEASKIFAYCLGKTIRGQSLTLLTSAAALEDIPDTSVQAPIFTSGRFDVWAKMRLFAYLRRARDRFDITHYLFTPTVQNAAFIRRFAFPTRGKTIQTIATVRDDLYSPDQLRRIFFADRLVTYTDLAKDKLIKLGFRNVTRISPGIDLERYRHRSRDDVLLSTFGFDRSHFVVSYPGEYVRLGATDMIADAFIDYFTRRPDTDIRLVFACRVKNAADEKKKAEVKDRFFRAHVLKFVAFSNTLADMPALYNTSDVILFPLGDLKGKFDVPLIVPEAYACETPVILSDLPQFSEFSNPDICVTIPRGSGARLIESVAYLKDHPDVRSRMGRAARAFVETRFDLKQTARQYEELYASL